MGAMSVAAAMPVVQDWHCLGAYMAPCAGVAGCGRCVQAVGAEAVRAEARFFRKEPPCVGVG